MGEEWIQAEQSIGLPITFTTLKKGSSILSFESQLFIYSNFVVQIWKQACDIELAYLKFSICK